MAQNGTWGVNDGWVRAELAQRASCVSFAEGHVRSVESVLGRDAGLESVKVCEAVQLTCSKRRRWHKARGPDWYVVGLAVRCRGGR